MGTNGRNWICKCDMACWEDGGRRWILLRDQWHTLVILIWIYTTEQSLVEKQRARCLAAAASPATAVPLKPACPGWVSSQQVGWSRGRTDTSSYHTHTPTHMWARMHTRTHTHLLSRLCYPRSLFPVSKLKFHSKWLCFWGFLFNSWILGCVSRLQLDLVMSWSTSRVKISSLSNSQSSTCQWADRFTSATRFNLIYFVLERFCSIRHLCVPNGGNSHCATLNSFSSSVLQYKPSVMLEESSRTRITAAAVDEVTWLV